MARLKHVTDIGVARLAAGCSKLRYLDMSGLIYLSDGKQRDFALTGLQVFDARGQRSAVHSAVHQAEPCPHLMNRLVLCFLPKKNAQPFILYPVYSIQFD